MPKALGTVDVVGVVLIETLWNVNIEHKGTVQTAEEY